MNNGRERTKCTEKAERRSRNRGERFVNSSGNSHQRSQLISSASAAPLHPGAVIPFQVIHIRAGLAGSRRESLRCLIHTYKSKEDSGRWRITGEGRKLSIRNTWMSEMRNRDGRSPNLRHLRSPWIRRWILRRKMRRQRAKMVGLRR